MARSVSRSTRPFKPSSIETIDEALYNYINDELNLFVSTASGKEKVPIVWQTTERTYQIKNNLESRDQSGKLILPLISVTRQSIEKDPSFKGKVQAHIFERNDEQGGSILVARKIKEIKTSTHQESKNLRQKNDKFHPLTSGKILYEETYMPVPVYVKVMYSLNLRTEYIQQMNELISPFLAKTGQIWSFTISHEGHRYEAFIEQSITDNKNTSNLGEQERKFETEIKLKVLGYLTNEGENRDRPYHAKRETIVNIVLRERVVTGPIPTKIPEAPPPDDPYAAADKNEGGSGGGPPPEDGDNNTTTGNGAPSGVPDLITETSTINIDSYNTLPGQIAVDLSAREERFTVQGERNIDSETGEIVEEDEDPNAGLRSR